MITSTRLNKIESRIGIKSRQRIIVGLPDPTNNNEPIWLIDSIGYKQSEFDIWKKKNKIKIRSIVVKLPDYCNKAL